MSLSHDMLLFLKLFQSSTEPCVKQGDAADDAFKNAVIGRFDQRRHGRSGSQTLSLWGLTSGAPSSSNANAATLGFSQVAA